MQLEKVQISGFQSYHTEQTFVPVKAGLTLILGERWDHEDMGDDFRDIGENGTGKSGIGNAICWCLYGKTSDGLKGPQLKNWFGEHPTYVTTTLSHEGTTYKITREQTSPIRLVLKEGDKKEQPVSQAELDELLGMDYELFVAVCYHGQHTPMFFDYGTSKQTKIIGRLVDTGPYERALEKSREEVQERKKKAAQLEGRLESQRESLEDLEGEETEDEDLDEVEDAIADAQEELKLFRKRKVYLDRLDELTETISEYRRAKDQINKTVERLKAEANSVVKELTKLDISKCPTCNQNLSARKTNDLTRVFEKRLKGIEQKICTEKDKGSELEDHIRKAKLDKRKLENKLDKLPGEDDDPSRELNKLQLRKQVLLQRDGNLVAAQIAELRSRIDETKKAIRKNARQLDGASQLITHFTRVRLAVIDGVLLEFGAEVTRHLPALGMKGWGVRILSSRKRASGKHVDEFHVEVTPPKAPRPIDWNLTCGGERQRLRLAGCMGLRALFSRRSPRAPTWEFWDEPSAHLNVLGVDHLAGLFYARARAEGLSTLLIDHRIPRGGQIGRTVIVGISPAGSHLGSPDEYRRKNRQPSNAEVRSKRNAQAAKVRDAPAGGPS